MVVKKFNYNWVKITNKSGGYRWVLASAEKVKKVIPRVKHKVATHIKRKVKR